MEDDDDADDVDVEVMLPVPTTIAPLPATVTTAAVALVVAVAVNVIFVAKSPAALFMVVATVSVIKRPVSRILLSAFLIRSHQALICEKYN